MPEEDLTSKSLSNQPMEILCLAALDAHSPNPHYEEA